MNHLDYNYEQHYYPYGLLAVNAMTPNPDNKTKFLCSIWNANANIWVDFHYQIHPVAMFILVTVDEATRMKSIKMDEIYSKLEANVRIRIILEFKKKTGKEIEQYSLPKMTASDVDKQHLTNMTLKKLQETKMLIIDEFKMDEPELYDYQKAAIEYLKASTEMETIIPTNKQTAKADFPMLPTTFKLSPIFQSAFPSPVPLKSNMSKITWNIKDYIPFDTFTILNNLSKDYAYN